MRIRKLFTGLLLLLFFGTGNTQNLQFKHFTTDDGLTKTHVISIGKDANGYMWFGTSNGLNKFDGYTIKNYYQVPDSSTSLPSNNIQCIHLDKQDNLWFGSYFGLTRYNPDFDNFININSSTLAKNLPNEIRDITSFKENELWLATNNGLVLFNTETNKVTLFKNDPNNTSSISSNNVQKLFIDKKNNIWVATANGLNYFDTESKTFQTYSHDANDPNSIFTNNITDLGIDKFNNLWLASNGSGLGRINLSSINDPKFIHYSNDPLDDGSLTNNRTRRILIDNNGEVWIGTENGGIDKYDYTLEKFIHFKFDPNNPKSLNNDSIYSLFQDETDDFWIGTFSGGVNQSIKNGDAILHYKTVPGNENSLSNNSVSDIVKSATPNTFWISTDGGGFNYFDLNRNTFQRFTAENSALNRNAVLGLYYDSDGLLYAGTWAGGINVYDTNSGEFNIFNMNNSGLQQDNIFSINKENNSNTFWVGTNDSGINKFIPGDTNSTYFSQENSDMPAGTVRKIDKLASGKMLICSDYGFSLFDPSSNSFFTLSYALEEENRKLSGEVVGGAAMTTDEKTVYIGTSGGLDVYNFETKKITRYTTKDGLISNEIRGVILYKSHLWLSTMKGISRFDLKTKRIKNYTKADGLLGEFAATSYLKAPNGALFFGGNNNGFNIIYPDKIKQNEFPPPIELTKFKISNNLVLPGENSVLSKDISQTYNLELNYKQSSFTIEFAALDYTAPIKNQYKYIMEGFEEKWNQVGNLRQATYTNLSPGKYTFKVTGSNNDGIWNDVGRTLKIVITPPFWETLWFRAIALLFVIGWILVFIFRARRRRLKLEAINQKLRDEIHHAQVAEEERQKVSEQIEKEHQVLHNSVSEILAKIEKFANGDITISFGEDTDGEIGQLKRGLNQAIGKIRNMLHKVTELASVTTQAVHQLSVNSTKLAEGASEQATQATEVSTAIEEMASTVEETNANAELASKNASHSEKLAKDGGEILHTTIKAMTSITDTVTDTAHIIQELGNSSDEIGKIIKVIDDIAFQTNLLALNAAVEAARAGEAGKGFAVVAGEVKSLSQRTAESVQEVDGMIQDIQEKIKNAVSSIQKGTEFIDDVRNSTSKSESSLNDIITSSEQLLDEISRVAAAINQLSSSSEHITQNISAISNVTDETAHSTNELANTAEHLEKLNNDLAQTLAKFKIN